MPGGRRIGDARPPRPRARPTSRAPTSRPSSPARWPSSAAGASRHRRLRGRRRRPDRRDRDAARAARWTSCGSATSTRADRLDELDFELPLVGGDAPTAQLTLSAVAGCSTSTSRPTTRSPATPLGCATRSSTARCAATSPAASTPSCASERPTARPLRPRRLQDQLARRRRRGTRAPGTTGQPRSPRRCSARHYPLQALLYLVALHRYLRWRLPGYDPERHLGRRALPVPAGDDRRRHAAGRRRSPAASSRGGRRRRSSWP